MGELPVMETFYTIQGEGYYAGYPAYFIRLGGCDIGCHWCDVKESWDSEMHPKKTVTEIVSNIPEQVKLAVITGGEPCMYDLTILTQELKKREIQTNLETSGAYEIMGDFDWICLSPKKRKLPLDSSLQKANELKVVIYNQDDFNFAEFFGSKITDSCKRFLQVEWSKRETMMQNIIDYSLANPQWAISVQIHKYLKIR